MASYPSQDAQHGRRWAVFAVVVFITLGALNLIDGVAALVQDDYFKADELLFGDLSLWGVLYVIIGALQIVTAWLISRGSFTGALIGLCLAGLNMIIALLSIGAYPLWSAIILVGDGVVIYALTVYGDALRPAST
jgi:hypothetical protein